MSDSYIVNLNPNSWVDISQSNLSIKVSNEGANDIRVISDNSQPSNGTLIGHKIMRSHPPVDFSLDVGQTLWARSIRGNSVASVTAGV